MGQVLQEIDDGLRAWLEIQPLFFVASAPLAADGFVNLSPKGGNSLRVVSPRQVIYRDGAGSGVETIAHVRENHRIVIMACAFEGSPLIVRVHGRGEVLEPTHREFRSYLELFPRSGTTRAVMRIQVERVASSCGYGVPLMNFLQSREDSDTYLSRTSDAALRSYLKRNNLTSIDGLPGLTESEIDNVVVYR
ncbi:MAG: pyridoxamine 5'-phosphate oxidase family protein [Steroidobacteraceae bacterium]